MHLQVLFEVTSVAVKNNRIRVGKSIPDSGQL